MNAQLPYMVASAALFAFGLYGLMTASLAIRKIIAVNVLGTAVFLVFVVLAAAGPGRVPDPVPHAMVLTGIVVAVCGTGLALALTRRIDESEDHSEAREP